MDAELGGQYKQGASLCVAVLSGACRSGGTHPTRNRCRRALAVGVDELVTAYRARVLDLEQELLTGATLYGGALLSSFDSCLPGRLPPSTAALGAALTQESNLLPAVHGLIASVRREALAGGPLLCRLAERAQGAGDPQLGTAYTRLLWHVNVAVVRHMTSWMAHGELTDSCGEFFIGRVPADDAPGAPSTSDDGGASEWHSTFQLRLAHVPPWLDVHTAEGVLFVGKAARMLSPTVGGGPSTSHGLAEEVALALRPPGVAVDVAVRTKVLLLPPTLERSQVEACVQALRDDAAQRLWTLLVHHGQLPAHLAALRAYLLCGKGDLLDTFLEEAKPLLSQPPRPSGASAALAVPFASAAGKSSAGEDPLFGRVHITFGTPAPVTVTPAPATPQPVTATPPTGQEAPPGGGRYVPCLDGWDPVTLTYDREWPLGVLLTPGAMDVYSSLFQYLFRLKRAQTALARAWTPLRRAAPGRGGGGALALRHRMDALLGAWAQYCHVDVVEPAHGELLRAVDAAQDWGAASRAHATCLATMQSGLLLDVKAVATSLEALVQLALAMQALACGEGGSDGDTVAGYEVTQGAVDELDAHRAFADGRGDAFYARRAEVADGEDALLGGA